MKIVGISTSAREKGNTSRLVRRVLERLAALGAQTEFVWAGGKTLEYCTACEYCMTHGACIKKDDYQPILKSVLEADGLVLGSPNYAFQMSAIMKTIYERSHCLLYYTRQLAGKYALGIAVGGHRFETGKIAKTIAQGVWLCGGYYSGYLGAVSVRRDDLRLVDEDKTFSRADKLAEKLFSDIKNSRPHRLQRLIRKIFLYPQVAGMVRNNKDKYPYLYNFYLDRKWLKG
ncbi:MAG: flavodoxin family protein [Planctomycetes bacterium]|nr:flavodoxin family protein [Planctomycetota bacterium]